MTPGRLEQARQIARRAASLPAEQRGAYLDRACGSDAELRAAAEALLAEATAPADEPGRPHSPPKPDYQATTAAAQPSLADPSGPHIPGYRLVRRLSHGGQGIVFEALQRSTRQKVAIKVLHSQAWSSRSARRLREIISALREIEHMKIIRIGSKIPAFDPWRILNDTELQAVLREHSRPEKRIYLMAHFDHPRELTEPALESLARYIECGVICVNQCPLIRGINDDADVLAELWSRLSHVGCSPYYLFQGRPTAGNEPYEVPIVEGWEVFHDALTRESGLAGRVRYAMSHETGKVEICGVDRRHIYLRYHRSKYPQNRGKFFVCKRRDDAYWLDQLEPAEGSYIPFGVPFECFGGKPYGVPESQSRQRVAGAYVPRHGQGCSQVV